MTQQVHCPNALAIQVSAWKKAGFSVGLVPTMGNLHDGHLSLVSQMLKHADKVIVSIFVNPTQFGPNEDFDAYPRTEAQDIELLDRVGADLVYLPQAATMYPTNQKTPVIVKAPDTANILCGAHRPGHFDGVLTVVAKLFNQIQPDYAIFGEKDFQQLTLLSQMVNDLNMRVKVLCAPIVREANGLAMSSRNNYLTDKQKQTASFIYDALKMGESKLKDGASVAQVEAAVRAHLSKYSEQIDYCCVLNANSLNPPAAGDNALILLVALHYCNVRLIDNLRVELKN